MSDSHQVVRVPQLAIVDKRATRNNCGMCVTIQLVVPASDEALVSAALSNRMSFWGERIGKAPNGDLLLAVTANGGRCQCTTSLGSVQPPAPLDGGADARKMAAMRRQGWSESKIKRWLEEKKRSEPKHDRALHAPPEGASRGDLDSWRELIADVLAVGSGRIGVRVGSDYRIVLEPSPVVVPLDELDTARLRGLAYDTLHTFVSN
jgi:hypothetical protein